MAPLQKRNKATLQATHHPTPVFYFLDPGLGCSVPINLYFENASLAVSNPNGSPQTGHEEGCRA
jgi:hypothetical protein